MPSSSGHSPTAPGLGKWNSTVIAVTPTSGPVISRWKQGSSSSLRSAQVIQTIQEWSGKRRFHSSTLLGLWLAALGSLYGKAIKACWCPQGPEKQLVSPHYPYSQWENKSLNRGYCRAVIYILHIPFWRNHFSPLTI